MFFLSANLPVNHIFNQNRENNIRSGLVIKPKFSSSVYTDEENFLTMSKQTQSNWDVIVVGGGPAGFFAAIRCAELNPQLRVLIIEKSSQTLGKVLISGGGRCNVTHACFDPAQLVTYYPRGGMALRGAFTRFQPTDTIKWFEEHGVKLKTEADNRMFPVTDSSETGNIRLSASVFNFTPCSSNHLIVSVG